MPVSSVVTRTMVVVCLAVSIVSGTTSVQAQRFDENMFSGPMREYQIQLAKVLIVRGRNIGYRSPFGGVPVVSFIIDQSGIIEQSRLKQTSGSPYIDSLAMELVRAGTRYPPFPAHSPVSKMEITVPLRFLARP